MATGLVTYLVGAGVLDEDEDDSLFAEIQALIKRFGPDALAEDLICYE